VADVLRRLALELAPDPAVADIRTALPAVGARLQSDLAQTAQLLRQAPSLEGLQTQDLDWLSRERALGDWLATLTGRVTRLQEALTEIERLSTIWTLTRQASQAAGDPQVVLQQIDDTLAALGEAAPRLRTERDALLELQGQVAEGLRLCTGARTRILAAQQGSVAGLFRTDGQPLWSRRLWSSGLDTLPARLRQIGADWLAQFRAYLTDPSKRMPLHLGLTLATLAMLLSARTRVRRWQAAGEDLGPIGAVFERPFAAAALLGLMVATSLPSPAPLAVKELLGALALIPLILLARPRLDPAVQPALYTLGLLFALDRVRHAFGGIPPLVGQTIVFLESLAGAMVLLHLILRLRAHRQGSEREGPGLRLAWRLLGGTALAALLLGLFASLTGDLQLAAVSAPAVLVGAVDALWLYAIYEVAVAAAAFALRLAPLKHLHLVQHHQDRLLRGVQRGLLWLAVLAWWARYLDYLGLWAPAQTLVEGALAARLSLGSFSTSAEDLLAFVLTLWASWLLAAALRFVLEEDVYPRTRIPRGMSYAASSLLQYGLVTLGLFIGFGFLGVTLTQVTVFAGALGVGVGLGLQGVVQNFVSGLLLLFEQPIHVGDRILAGAVEGRVLRIGIRASVIRTAQGAEVIIPNSQLTSRKVSNWTLSDQRRRLDLAISMGGGHADPARLIAVLEETARAHPRVLRDPPPRALLKDRKDDACTFELQVWTEYEAAGEVESDLRIAIAGARDPADPDLPPGAT
jgi:small-conductance mechanosensitive channel